MEKQKKIYISFRFNIMSCHYICNPIKLYVMIRWLRPCDGWIQMDIYAGMRNIRITLNEIEITYYIISVGFDNGKATSLVQFLFVCEYA